MQNGQMTQNIVFSAFPKKVLEQATAATKLRTSSQLARRHDLRSKTVLTFSETADSNAECAISLNKSSSGWQLTVHIADVAEYVCEGSPLDSEARYRNAAFRNGFVKSDMLPEGITNEVCNLQSGKDRLCVSVLLDIDTKGNLNDVLVEETVVRVAEKCVYTELDQLGMAQEASSIHVLREKYRPYMAILTEMYELAAIFCDRRRKNGGLDCSVYRRTYNRDENGRVIGFSFETEPDSRAMVREIGYFAAEAIGSYLYSNKMPCIFIGQQGLGDEELDYLAKLLDADTVCASKLGRTVELAELAKGSKYYDFVCGALRERLPRAEFSTQPIYNLHCASDKVVSFVRPATRYTDLLTQRTLKTCIAASSDPKNLNINRYRQLIQAAAESANRAEEFVHGVTMRFRDIAAQEYIESSEDTIFYGFPFKREPDGRLLVNLLCGANGYVPAELASDSLEFGRLSAFEITDKGNEEVLCSLKPTE
ncbi:MAG: RNB domain-containing ribonuclease [Clostridia bacterium]|nr:RNB domain-containing ribonuclease [Clostridia bacterium]